MFFHDFMKLFLSHLGKDQKIEDNELKDLCAIIIFLYKNKKIHFEYHGMDASFKNNDTNKEWRHIKDWKYFIISSANLLKKYNINMLLIRKFTDIYNIRFGSLIKKHISLKWIYPSRTLMHIKDIFAWYESRYEIPFHWYFVIDDGYSNNNANINDDLFFKKIYMFDISKNIDFDINVNIYNKKITINQKYPSLIKNIQTRQPKNITRESIDLENEEISFEKRYLAINSFCESACLLRYFFIQIQKLENLTHILQDR